MVLTEGGALLTFSPKAAVHNITDYVRDILEAVLIGYSGDWPIPTRGGLLGKSNIVLRPSGSTLIVCTIFFK